MVSRRMLSLLRRAGTGATARFSLGGKRKEKRPVTLPQLSGGGLAGLADEPDLDGKEKVNPPRRADRRA